ncbi:MAG: MTAP family purine nucleoside phosphorylase [Eubacteriales bacterium]|nr:MTAP family purine nucleoside phosphorylase [Eubacteriales bacterium]
MKYAIIGGTNMDTLPIPFFEDAISTPYGDVVLYRGQLDCGTEIIFRARHGVLFRQDAPEINYRANIYALHMLGVTHVLGLASVGACDYGIKVGNVCLINDFIDLTKSRPSSFLREHRSTLHTGMEDVFSPELNDSLEKLILSANIPYSGRAIYACTEGPRFETAAEIRMIRILGAQITGMTLVPEAPLARDLGMQYAAIGMVTNYCTGMTSYVTDDDIGSVMSTMRESVFNLCFSLIRASAC